MYLVNLLKNPKPDSTSGFSSSSYGVGDGSAPSISVSDQKLVLTSNHDTGQGWVNTYAVGDVKPNTQYTLSFYLDSSMTASTVAPYLATMAANSNSSFLNTVTFDGKGKRYTVTGETDDHTDLLVRLYAPQGVGLTSVFRDMILCTSSDYEQLQALGLDWFYYDTMPLSGGGVPLSSHDHVAGSPEWGLAA